MILNHLRPQELYDAKAGDSAIRRLARKVGRIDRLVRVTRADQRGRHPMIFGGFPEGEWLLENAKRLEVEDAAPRPLVLGRHLIQRGLTPGPAFKAILAKCYEAQLDGIFSTTEDGIEHARTFASAQPDVTGSGMNFPGISVGSSPNENPPRSSS